MSRLLVTAAVAGALVLGGSLAHAQSKGAKGGKLSLVEAMCPGAPPTVAKCNPATMVSGSAGLKSAKQPQPFNLGTASKAATASIKGLTYPGLTGADCELDLTTSFGTDADVGPAHCALAGTTVGSVPGGLGTIPCVVSTSVPGAVDCKGTLFAPSQLPDNCTNVRISGENPVLACWSEGNIGTDSEKLVTMGIVVLPGPDCTGQAAGTCK